MIKSEFIDKIAAKSPDFVIKGPDVILIFDFISLAIIWANVVFPKPGGPYSKIWSIGSLRAFAADINTDKLLVIFSCPIKSFKDKLVVHDENDKIKAVQTMTLWGFRVLTFIYHIELKSCWSFLIN